MFFKKIIKNCFAPILFFMASTAAFFAVEDVPFLTFQQLNCQVNQSCPRKVDVSDGVLFYISIFLYCFGGLFILFKIFFDTRAEDKRTLSFRNKIWETEIKAFANNLKITPDDRITLYIYIEKTKTFFKAGRESPSNKYKHGGRKSYTSGLIETAFNSIDGTIEITACPIAEHKKYVDEVFSKSGIEKTIIKKLSMKSRYLYARKVQKLNGTPIGVLLFETTKQTLHHIVDETGNSLDEARIKRIFKRECDRLSFFLEEFELPDLLFQFEEGQVRHG